MLGESLLDLWRQYYQKARPQGEYLFPGYNPQGPICTTAASQGLRQVVRQTALNKKVSMHTWRHCFATTLRYSRITDRLVQKLVSPLDIIQPAS
jgi:integrase/recombinase XerD